MSTSAEIIGDLIKSKYVKIRDKDNGNEFLLPWLSWVWFQAEMENPRMGTVIEFDAIHGEKFVPIYEAMKVLQSTCMSRCIALKDAKTGEWNFEVISSTELVEDLGREQENFKAEEED